MSGRARAGGGDRRRFLKMSAFAWSVAAGLTAASWMAFPIIPDRVSFYEDGILVTRWYRPTFAETRTCFDEVPSYFGNDVLRFRSQKWGTALFYYVPTLDLVAANCVFLWLTRRRVRYLRRGTSLLKKVEREGNGWTTGRGGVQRNEGYADESNVVVVYMKLLLAGGAVEFLGELITWAASRYNPLTNQPTEGKESYYASPILNVHALPFADHTYAHRTVGYWADLFRALVVLLVLVVAPDLRAVWRRMRGKGGDSPARGAATRPAPRHFARPAPRTGQQKSAV